MYGKHEAPRFFQTGWGNYVLLLICERRRLWPGCRAGGNRNALDSLSIVQECAVQRRTEPEPDGSDRKSTRLNSSHSQISYAVFCLKKKKKNLFVYSYWSCR